MHCIVTPRNMFAFSSTLIQIQFSWRKRLKSRLHYAFFSRQYLVDIVQSHSLVQSDLRCEHLVIDSLMYHLFPARRPTLSRPRPSTLGHLYTIGGMDNSKGDVCFLALLIASHRHLAMRSEKQLVHFATWLSTCFFISTAVSLTLSRLPARAEIYFKLLVSWRF